MAVEARPLDVCEVTKAFGPVLALDRLDLRAEAGTVTALLGPNGAGKTTLARVIAGLISPDGGRVAILGRDVRRDRRALDHVGYASQEVGVYPTRTIRENLKFFGRLAGVGPSSLGRRVDDLVTALRLGGQVDRRAMHLSGGQRRRLHTAIALVGRAEVVLLDEPTAGVDVETRSAVVQLVRQVADEGAAVCYTTHYLPEVEELNGEVVIIDRGRIVAQGHVDQLIGEQTTSLVTFGFDGRVPTAVARCGQPGPSSVQLASANPSAQVAETLSLLGPDAIHVTSIDITRPSLESAYRQIIGAQTDGEPGPQASQATAPAAST